MAKRLAAAVAGAVLILLSCATYSLQVQPRIAESDTAAPLFAAVELPPGAEHCQDVSRLPAKANRVRVGTSAVKPAPGRLRVTISDARGVLAEGLKTDVVNATLPVRLDRLTRSAHPARICFSNVGNSHIALAGEEKRLRREPGAARRKQRVVSVVFLRPGSSSWAGRAGAIADRFAGANRGAFGGWSLWAAAAMLIFAVGLAFWWLVFRLGPDPE